MKYPGHVTLGLIGLILAVALLTCFNLTGSDKIQFAVSCVMLLGILGLVTAYFYSIFTSFSDANRRGKSGWLVALFVAFVSWPIGWIAWLIFRPNIMRRN
jgi:chromate transport protein ChrA